MADVTVQIPLSNGVYKNVDGVALTDRDFKLMNCYIDELGFCNKRSGAQLIWDIGGFSTSPINGAYWFENKTRMVLVTSGRPVSISRSGGVYSNWLTYVQNLATNNPVTFAEDADYVFFANGGRIVYWDGEDNNSYKITSANAPIASTHIGWLDGYLLAAGDNTNKFYWSDVNTPLTWNALNYASASGNADPITALKVFQRQIFLFGARSFEVWQNAGDVDAPFLREPGGYYEVGCVAPYSIICHNQDIYWLSDKRRFVKFSNGSIKNVSTQYDKEIAKLEGVNGCLAMSVVVNGRIFLAFNFQDAGRTLVYDVEREYWHEWGSWDVFTGDTGMWLGNCAAWSPVWGKNIVGSRKESKVYDFRDDQYSDDGDAIRVVRQTGRLDYGTKKFKRSKEIRVRIKRGQGLENRTPKISFRWQDDNKSWSNYKELSLGDTGDYDIVLRYQNLGMYRTRQYEFVVSDNVPVVFGQAEEDLTIL